MGFYGNITNTSRTSFSFDKTYSNRYDMDTSCGSDGIYAGRYVLVEYDAPQSEDTYPKYYYYRSSNIFYILYLQYISLLTTCFKYSMATYSW